MQRIYNFSAGPAILPVSVLEKASAGVLEIHNSGMSILEVSHRGKDYDVIHADALRGVLKTLNLSPDEYAVALTTGGASLQFAMLPMNFLGRDQTADYVDTGDWSARAAKEAKRYGTVHISGSSAATKYDRIPAPLTLSENPRYLHITTNNTIEGTQFFDLPEATDKKVPLVADLSSDIFAVDRDYSEFDLIYAGTQKNAGIAGVTIVVVRRSFLESGTTDVPPMLSYRTQVEKESLYNTPPVFAVYVLKLVMDWIESEGGVSVIAARNREKAALVYTALDAAPYFYQPCVTNKADRSIMNVTFRLADESLEGELLAEAKSNHMDGLKGHRSVGGFRASIYNAFPREGCVALAHLLTDFARRKG